VPPFGEDDQENSIQLRLTKEGEIIFRYGKIESARIFVLDVPSFMAIIPSDENLDLHEVMSSSANLSEQLETEGAWIQSIGMETREIIHAIVTNLIWLMIGFVAFILLIFPFFYNSSLVRPINKLLHGVRKVNEGDLDTEVPISVKDEIGYLTHNFNKMTQSLRNYNEKMESLVSERTAKLEKSLKTLQAAQQQLVQQEKLASLGQLTAGIAHEIKNPLNFVNNFSDLSMELIEETKEDIKNAKKRMNNSSDEGSKTQEIIKTIETNLEIVETNLSKISNHGLRADGIVKSMLQHSRGGSEKVELTDLNMLVKEYVNLAFHGMRASPNPINVDIDLKLDDAIGEVPLIAEDFSRVIVNLCNNAFDAMREKSKTPNGLSRPDYNPILKVRTKRSKNHISIEIEDNGIGIPEEIKEDVLQPFFTTKKGTQGTGLGLSITHDILKAHGGEIFIESEYKSYTLFKILLNTNHNE
jgi:signal transduction histidine kinase